MYWLTLIFGKEYLLCPVQSYLSIQFHSIDFRGHGKSISAKQRYNHGMVWDKHKDRYRAPV